MEQTLQESLNKSIAELELYLVINSSGQFFRAKGFGGYGNTWVNDIKKAKTYGKIGQARSRVTWFANSYPDYPTPAIIKLIIGSYAILNENERVAKAIKSKEQKAALRNAKEAKRELEYAKDKLKIAEKELAEARSKVTQTRI